MYKSKALCVVLDGSQQKISIVPLSVYDVQACSSSILTLVLLNSFNRFFVIWSCNCWRNFQLQMTKIFQLFWKYTSSKLNYLTNWASTINYIIYFSDILFEICDFIENVSSLHTGVAGEGSSQLWVSDSCWLGICLYIWAEHVWDHVFSFTRVTSVSISGDCDTHW